MNYKKRYALADITIEVNSPLPIVENTFDIILENFASDVEHDIKVEIYHQFSLPENMTLDGDVYYKKAPWHIYLSNDGWKYFFLDSDERIIICAKISKDFRRIDVYHKSDKIWINGGIKSLSALTSDMIFIAQILWEKFAFYLHSSTLVINGKGFIFSGHSGAGKTTIGKMLEPHGKILCDDRNILMKRDNGWSVYGSYNHSEWENVSPDSAPICGIFFLIQSPEDRIEKIEDSRLKLEKILSFMIKPMISKEWFAQIAPIIDKCIDDVPMYLLHFTKDGDIVQKLLEMA